MGDNSADNPAPNTEQVIRTMAQHRRHMNEYLSNISANSKIMSEEKYEQTVKLLKKPDITAEELGMTKQKFTKFKWWVNTDRKFKLTTEPLMNLYDVVMIKAKYPVRFGHFSVM